MPCSRGDVTFNSICLNVLEGIKQFYLLMLFKKTRLETPFKGDNVKAFIKISNCEILILYFSEKVKKIAAFAMLFWLSVTNRSFENGYYQKYPRHPLVLKINVTLVWPLRVVILHFLKWKFLSDDQRLYLHDSK